MGSRKNSAVRWSGLFLALILSPCLALGQDAKQPTTDAAKAIPSVSEKERPPFDLTFVPPDATGVVAIRPNAIFHAPAMKPLARMANESFLMQMFLPYIPYTDLKLSVQEIEQIVLFTRPPPDTCSKGDIFSAIETVSIRAAHDFDWLKQMRRIDPNTQEIRHGDQVYYRSHPKLGKGEMFSGLTIPPKATFCYLIPDKRTIVLVPFSLIQAVEKGERIKRPHFSWDKEWKHVEHDLVAIAQSDCQTCRVITIENGKEVSEPAEWTALTQKPTTMIAGVDWKDGFDLRAYLTFKEPSAAKQGIKDLKTYLKLSRREMTEYPTPPSEFSEVERQAMKFQLDLWKRLYDGVRIKREESTVCVHTKVKMTVAEIAKGLLSQFFELPSVGKSE